MTVPLVDLGLQFVTAGQQFGIAGVRSATTWSTPDQKVSGIDAGARRSPR